MSKVLEIEAALRQLPAQDQWEVARWLLEALEERTGTAVKGQNAAALQSCRITRPAAQHGAGVPLRRTLVKTRAGKSE